MQIDTKLELDENGEVRAVPPTALDDLIQRLKAAERKADGQEENTVDTKDAE